MRNNAGRGNGATERRVAVTQVIDLRTDAVTHPTEAMWEAMRGADLGWAALGEDRSVLELEALAAEMTGKKAALFVPTGTMANLVALMTHTRPGDQIVVEAASHILWSEEWAFASVCGLHARTVPGLHGRMDEASVEAAIRQRVFAHHPHTALLCLENTHNTAGGTVLSVAQTEALVAVAHRHGVPVHVDGSRLYNAAAALQVEPIALTRSVDSVAINLNKGLSCPMGAMLCGSDPFITEARIALKKVGGHGIHQAGIMAAAGIVALRAGLGQVIEDNRRARALAVGLAALPGVHVDLDTVETNIVMASVATLSAPDLAARLRERGIRVYVYTDETVRCVTHRHITDQDIERTLEAVCEVTTAGVRG